MSVSEILQDLKALETLFTCTICIGNLNNTVETRCGHRFCSNCIEGLLMQGKNAKCPLCKSALSKRNTKTSTHFSAKSYDIWNLLKISEFTRSSQGSPIKNAASSIKDKVELPAEDISSNTRRQEQVISWLQCDTNTNQKIDIENETSQKSDESCQEVDDVLVGSSATQDGLRVMKSHSLHNKSVRKSTSNATSEKDVDVFENLAKKRRRERSNELFGSDDENENQDTNKQKDQEELPTTDGVCKREGKPSKGKSKRRKSGKNSLTSTETRKRKIDANARNVLDCEDSSKDTSKQGSDSIGRGQDVQKKPDVVKKNVSKSLSADKENIDIKKGPNTVIRSKKRLKLNVNLDKTPEKLETENKEDDLDLFNENCLPSFNLKVKGKSRKPEAAKLENPNVPAKEFSKQIPEKDASSIYTGGEKDSHAEDDTIMEIASDPTTVDDDHNNRDSTPPIDDSLCSDKDEIWSTPPAPNKSEFSNTAAQTQDTLPTIISAKPARVVKKSFNNEDILKDMAQDIQLLRKKMESIEANNDFIKSIKNEMDELLAKLDLQVFKGLEAPPSQVENETDDDMNSIAQHREELEVSKNLIDNIKAVANDGCALEIEPGQKEKTDESKKSVNPDHHDVIGGAVSDDFELPANNVLSQNEDPSDEDSLIPETPQKSRKRKRKSVISDDEDSDNEKSTVATQLEEDNNSVDTTPIQRSKKKKSANKFDDESDNDGDGKKMEEDVVKTDIPAIPKPVDIQLPISVDKPEMTNHNCMNVSVIEDSMPSPPKNMIKGSIKIVEVPPADLSKTTLTKKTPPPAIIKHSRKIGIMTSQLSGKPLKIVHSFINKFQATYNNSFKHSETTHLIVKTQQKRCDRTFKYLQALASKIWVVDIRWMSDCIAQKKLIPEDDYEVAGDNQESDMILSYAPKRSRESDAGFKLLSKHVFHCHPPFSFFSTKQLEELLVLCGAQVVSSLQEFHQFSSDDYQKYVIVDDDVDSQESSLNYSEIGAEFGAETIPNTWILESVATFTLQPTDTYPLREEEDEDDDIMLVQ